MRIGLFLLALVLAPPIAADAQSADETYCGQLSAIYRRYIQNSPGRQYDAEAAVAQDDCQKGRAEAAIPVLERKLQESGFTLPKRPTQ